MKRLAINVVGGVCVLAFWALLGLTMAAGGPL